MSYDIPTPSEIQKRQEAESALATGNQRASIAGTPENAIARSTTITVNGLYNFLHFISQQILPTTSEDEYLEEHANFWLDEGRKDPSAALGPVIVVGTVGASIPAETIVTRPDGETYTFDEDITIPAAGTVEGRVTSDAVGLSLNTAAGITLTLSAPIVGISSITVGDDGLTGGSNEEGDDFVLDRIIDRVQTPAQGGSINDYITWAKEVPGVTRAFAQQSDAGVVTVDVTLVMDNKTDNIIPSETELQTVRDYIEGVRPVGARPYVFAPATQAIDFSIALNPNTVAVQTAVRAELEDFFTREATPNGVTLYLSRISESISVATEEFQHELGAPEDNIVIDFGTLPVLGEITWSAS